MQTWPENGLTTVRLTLEPRGPADGDLLGGRGGGGGGRDDGSLAGAEVDFGREAPEPGVLGDLPLGDGPGGSSLVDRLHRRDPNLQPVVGGRGRGPADLRDVDAVPRRRLQGPQEPLELVLFWVALDVHRRAPNALRVVVLQDAPGE